MKEAMRSVRRHGNPTLQKFGLAVMIVGAVLFVLPAPPPDPFATAHELFEMTIRHYWWQCVGMGVYVLGNTLRLIGKQGHPGLPLPRLGPSIEVIAAFQLRKRARENLVAAMAGQVAPAVHATRWKYRLTARRAARRHGMPLPRGVRPAPAYAN
jgi:hypothetical protein